MAGLPDYLAEAQALLAAGLVEEAIWVYEAALRDPRLIGAAAIPNIEFRLAALWLHRASAVTEPDRIRRMLDRAILLYKQCLLRRPGDAETLLNLALTQFGRFQHTADRNDLLAANMTLHTLEEFLRMKPDSDLGARLAALLAQMKLR